MITSAPESSRAVFEAFLVEDVILTLGNLRGALGWLGGGSPADRACLDRLDRQLSLLEDRARRLALALSAETEAEAPVPANLFAAPAVGGGDRARLPARGCAVFRSRRTPGALAQAESPIPDVASVPAATSASIAWARSSSRTSKSAEAAIPAGPPGLSAAQ